MAHGGGQKHATIAVTLAAAAVLAAALGARSALLYDRSDAKLGSAVRTAIKRGVATVEDVRFVYSDEAPNAFRYARAQVSADALQQAAAKEKGVARESILFEADAQARIAKALLPASDIAKTSRYRTSGGAYDVGRRLGDVRNKAPDLVALDPGPLERKGESLAWHGNLDAATTLAAAVAFFLAALAQAFGGRLRLPLLGGAWGLILAGIAAAATFEFVLP